jgi:hypothetical protein
MCNFLAYFFSLLKFTVWTRLGIVKYLCQYRERTVYEFCARLPVLYRCCSYEKNLKIITNFLITTFTCSHLVIFQINHVSKIHSCFYEQIVFNQLKRLHDGQHVPNFAGSSGKKDKTITYSLIFLLIVFSYALQLLSPDISFPLFLDRKSKNIFIPLLRYSTDFLRGLRPRKLKHNRVLKRVATPITHFVN